MRRGIIGINYGDPPIEAPMLRLPVGERVIDARQCRAGYWSGGSAVVVARVDYGESRVDTVNVPGYRLKDTRPEVSLLVSAAAVLIDA